MITFKILNRNEYTSYQTINELKSQPDSQYQYLINESQESDSINKAKDLMVKSGNYTREEADKFIRIDLRNDLPSLRDKKCAKFILGVTRMFLNKELKDDTTILNLDKTIKLITVAHYNEYNKDLNSFSADELINKFSDVRRNQDTEKRNELRGMKFQKHDYDIVLIDSFEEANEYSEYTTWCVTHDEDAFDSYTANGEAQFYFCLKKGFENIREIKGDNCPLDEYGLSMIAVCVDSEGDLKTCTCRWNHDNGGNDSIMDEKQISEVVGVNFYEAFKPSNVLEDKINALKTMKEIPKWYFNNSKIKEIVIPDNIISIRIYAFLCCTSLESITIPDSVTEIEYQAFRGCTSLTNFYGKFASEDNRCLIIDSILNSFAPTGLTTYTIPDIVTSIGDWAFSDCTSLTSIIIPDSVTSIGKRAFYNCRSLTSVTIPDSVTSIGDWAFSNCTSLESVTIGNSVTSIGERAFYDCTSLESVTIGNSVTSIGERAFFGCDSLTEVTIPDNITDIGRETFRGCTSLTSITIPDSVTSIGDWAFSDCTSLTSITIPDRFKNKIGHIFYNTKAEILFTGQQNESKMSNVSNSILNFNEYCRRYH